jgi:hypothetical protein
MKLEKRDNGTKRKYDLEEWLIDFFMKSVETAKKNMETEKKNKLITKSSD